MINIDITMRIFDFSSHPDWMNIANPSKGEYAWKPKIIKEVFDTVSQSEEDHVVLWRDAGNLLIGRLNKIRRFIRSYGFWSPNSSGTIAQWTHKSLLRKLEVPNNILTKPNLNGAIVGFSNKSKKGI